MDTTTSITSLIYSEITKDLTITYNNGTVEKYVNVPKEVYESILNNGKTITNYLKENLESNYKKLTLV